MLTMPTSLQAGTLWPQLGVVKTEVGKLVRRMLGEGVTDEEPLMEAGLDSLGAVELRSSLGHAFGIDLPATLTFDYPSIGALSKFLASQVATVQPTAQVIPGMSC